MAISRVVILSGLFWVMAGQAGVRPGRYQPEGHRPMDPVQVLTSGQGTRAIITLQASDCTLLLQQVTAIYQWRKKLHQKDEPTLVKDCKKTADGKYQIEVQNLMPDLARTHHNTCTGRTGPNCFNAAMVMSHQWKNILATSSQELENWLQSPNCRALSSGELKMPGDIVTIRSGARPDVPEKTQHAFIWVSEHLSYAKENMYKNSLYELMNPSVEYWKYNVKPECRQVAPTVTLNECDPQSVVYRCEPLADQDRLNNVVGDPEASIHP